MKARNFSSFLLMGKVATLPLLIQSAQADVTPTFAEITGSLISVIPLPVAAQLSLKAVATDVSALTNTANAYASALLCPSASTNQLPAKISVVVTGVKAGETVYLAAALNKNDPANLALNSSLTLGTQGMVILGYATVIGSSSDASAAVTIPVDLTTTGAATLIAGGKFYIQAATIGATASSAAQWRISQLDMISIGQLQQDAYGHLTGYCV